MPDLNIEFTFSPKKAWLANRSIPGEFMDLQHYRVLYPPYKTACELKYKDEHGQVQCRSMPLDAFWEKALKAMREDRIWQFRNDVVITEYHFNEDRLCSSQLYIDLTLWYHLTELAYYAYQYKHTKPANTDELIDEYSTQLEIEAVSNCPKPSL